MVSDTRSIVLLKVLGKLTCSYPPRRFSSAILRDYNLVWRFDEGGVVGGFKNMFGWGQGWKGFEVSGAS